MGMKKAAVKEPQFNPHRVPRTDAARLVVAGVLNALVAGETRKRARKADDHATFVSTVTALVCDTIHHRLSGKVGGVAITRSKAVLERKSRYAATAMGGTLPAVVDLMRTLRFVRFTPGQRSSGFGDGKRSTITAAPRLVRLMRRHGLTLDDLGRDHGEEVVILKGNGKGQRGKLAEYADTDHSTIVSTRQRVQAINAYLAEADLDFDDDALQRAGRVDVSDRSLRRIYSRGSWEEGGRLWGGFWQPLHKAERAEGLSIDGEGIVEVDYSGMGPRLLYSIANSVPAFDDAYALPELPATARPGIKIVFSALTFAKGDAERDRFPSGSRTHFPAALRYGEVEQAIRRAHPAIAHLLGTEVGHRVFFRESEIMLDLLGRLQALGIVALPIHDAVLVKEGEAERVAHVMRSVTLDRLGFVIPVGRGKGHKA